MNIADTRRYAYAQELQHIAHLESPALVAAFATVPREQFLGPGPWNLLVVRDDGKLGYEPTATSNPDDIYQDVVVAIDPIRGLHNGQPQYLARWMDRLGLNIGMEVVHVGCGTGYYTAILAEIVGPTGHIVAFEVDPDLAERARANLNAYSQVDVVSTSATDLVVDGADAIFVNCGVTMPPLRWLLSLRQNARIVLPITASPDDSGVGTGAMFRFVRERSGFSVDHLSPAAFFPCIGARDSASNAKLLAKADSEWLAPKSVRMDAHAEDSTCWLHSDQYCLSTVAINVHAA